MSANFTTYTACVYPPGDSFNRVVITGLECSEHQVAATAKEYAEKSLRALQAVPVESWRVQILDRAEVTDL
ncbi:hypothetical protein [Burkholderia cepacia]|uniref:hypothetical protein n=1 Tax=Burkholderia cepacia TaxID=292 RepID=UPI001CF4CD2D|nr:hypothetical protein [Burkholderia cepacia]MCA8321207.1 hypothetical protein [Burkholderia cepacia]